MPPMRRKHRVTSYRIRSVWVGWSGFGKACTQFIKVPRCCEWRTPNRRCGWQTVDFVGIQGRGSGHGVIGVCRMPVGP
jgi:hypothetical protein